jgi:hypothetical protein
VPRAPLLPVWVQPALGLYPEANGADLGNGLAAWYGRNVRPSQLDSGLARIDHALTSRATLFARYNDSPSFNEFGSIQINRLDLRFKSLTLGLNLRPSSHWTIDLRGNESQAEAHSSWARAGQTNPSGCDLEPMTTYLFPAAGTCNALVRFSIDGVGQVVTGLEGTRRQRQFQTVESPWKSVPIPFASARITGAWCPSGAMPPASSAPSPTTLPPSPIRKTSGWAVPPRSLRKRK